MGCTTLLQANKEAQLKKKEAELNAKEKQLKV